MIRGEDQIERVENERNAGLKEDHRGAVAQRLAEILKIAAGS